MPANHPRNVAFLSAFLSSQVSKTSGVEGP
jgi:hypothetical protein